MVSSHPQGYLWDSGEVRSNLPQGSLFLASPSPPQGPPNKGECEFPYVAVSPRPQFGQWTLQPENHAPLLVPALNLGRLQLAC